MSDAAQTTLFGGFDPEPPAEKVRISADRRLWGGESRGWLPSDHQRDRNDMCRVCVYPGSEHTIGGPAPMGWGHCPHNPRRIAVVGGRTEPVERPRR